MSTIGEEEKSIITANNLFAVDLYRLLAREDQNLFISPFSVLTCLYMAYAGARKNTAAEMERVLHVAIQQDKFHEVFSHFSSLLAVSEGYEFAIANALSMKDKRQILESYKDIIKRAYDGEFLEFSIETINNWVTKKTHGHIKNIINPSDLSTTLLVLLNAVYFKGVWHFQFDEDVTRNSDFFLLSGKQSKFP